MTPERKAEIYRQADEYYRLDKQWEDGQRLAEWGSKQFHAGWRFTQWSWAILSLLFVIGWIVWG